MTIHVVRAGESVGSIAAYYGVDPARLEKEIPFAGVLLKKDKDLKTLQRSRR